MEDQLMFAETRRNSLSEIPESLYTSNGVEVVDVIRLFMGMVQLHNLRLVTNQGVDTAVEAAELTVPVSVMLHTATALLSHR